MRIEPSRPSATKGFSLIETVVGMGIVGILTISIYAALTTGFNTVRLAREDHRATQIFVELMDQLRVISWDQLTNGTSVPIEAVEAFDPEKEVVVKGAWHPNKLMNLGYYVTLDITNAPNDVTYSGDLKQITVNVAWRSGGSGGMKRSRSFTTFFARYGLHNRVI